MLRSANLSHQGRAQAQEGSRADGWGQEKGQREDKTLDLGPEWTSLFRPRAGKDSVAKGSTGHRVRETKGVDSKALHTLLI